MKLVSNSFADGEAIPGRCAFGVPDPDSHVALSDNLSPHLAWSDVPDGTRSFAICCVDVDVPTKPDDVNAEGREVPADLPRTEFTHWLIVDIPAAQTELAEGLCSQGVVARGKTQPPGPGRQGLNDYTGWFAGDADMAGDYLGFDGPCPPWNDSLLHHYHFTVYALDVEQLAVDGKFDLGQFRTALEGHVLGQASIVGRYSLNPRIANP